MSNLILIDTTCIRYHDEMIRCLTPNTDYLLFSYIHDTAETLKSKITKNYTNVVIAQHNKYMPTYGLTIHVRHGMVLDVVERDPELTTWKEHMDFYLWLRDERGVNTIDWLACNIWSEPHWVHIIRNLESKLNIQMRASTNITGPDGDYILESDNVNMIGLYFTENITKCPENYVTSEFNVYDQNYNDPLDGSGGTLYKTKYAGILHSPYVNNNITALSHTGHIGLETDISNVIYVAQLLNNTVGSYANGVPSDDAFIAVKSDRTGVIWGSRYSGALGQTSMYDASLVNIKRVYVGRGTFVVLKNDNTVYSCGNATYYVDGRYNVSPYVESPNTKAIPSPLTNVKAIYNNYAGFCALKYDGTVVTWGNRVNGGDSRVCQQYLTNITKIVVIKGWGGAFVALRSDGNFVAWKGDSNLMGGADASMNSYFATSIGSSLTGRIKDILFGETGPSNILFVRNDNMICMAAVNYYQNITQASNIAAIYTRYQLPTGVTIMSSVVFNLAQKLALSNDTTLIGRNSLSVISDSDLILCTHGSADGSNYLAFKLLRSGAVSPILGGNNSLNTTNGGYLYNATYGLPPNTDVSSNVVQIFTISSGVGALKADGTFVAWGCGGPNWILRYDSSANNVNNVVSAVEISEGYRLVCADGSLKHVYSQARRDFLVSQNQGNKLFGNYTPEEGKSIWSFNVSDKDILSSVPVEFDAYESASPSSVMRYNPTTITYVSNMYHRRALQGFKYGLYCGSRLISIFKPAYDTSTFTFTNSKVPDLGNNITLTVSRLSVTFPNTMFTFTVNTTENPSISIPDPPTINSISIGVERITVSLGAPSWDGGTGIDKYSYSMDGGSNWTLVDPSSSLVVTGLTGVLYSFVIRSLGGLGYSATNSASVVMCSVPNAPTVSSATAGNRSLSVVFSSPSGDTLVSTTFGNYTSLTSGTYVISGNANTLLNGTYTMSASSDDGTNLPHRAFDNSTTTFWSTASASYDATSGLHTGAFATVIQNVGTVSGEWIQIKSPSYIRVQSYSVVNNQAASVAFPADFRLVGSNDGSAWFPIDSRTGQTDTSANANNTVSYTVAVPTTNEFFKYYRLVVSRLNAGTQLALKDFRIVGNAVLLSNVKGYNYSLNGGAVTGYIGATQSPLVITGIDNGTSYTVSLRAVNAAGQGAASNTLSAVSVPSTVPEVPVINTLTYGDQSFSVAFTAPYSGGSAITLYQYTIDGGSTYVDVSASANPFVVSGLTNGTAYTISMRAVNAVGNSAVSASAGPVVPKRVPDAPVISSAIYGNQSGTVSFEATGSDGGSSITGYSYSVNGGADVAIASSPITLTGLTNGTTYTVSVKAINVVGSSAASTSASFVPKTVPSVPVISSATVHYRQVSLAITQASTGGSAITDYSYALDGSDVFVSVGTTLPIVITELNVGQTYSVVVKATNEVGTTEASSSVSFVPITIPDAPTIDSVSFGDRSAAITFTPPTNTGYTDITGYKLSVNGGEFNSIELVTSPFDVSGLTNGTTYTFAMKTINIIGDSSASNISDAVVPKTVPDAPVLTLERYYIDDNYVSMKVTINKGESDGGSPISTFTYTHPGEDTTTMPGTYQNIYGYNLTYFSATNNLGQVCDLSVYATNAVGNSAVTNISYLSATYPYKPTISSTLSVAGNRLVRLKYSPKYNTSPLLNSLTGAGGSPVTGMYYTLNGGPRTLATIFDASWVTITDLSENVPYTIELYAKNDIGFSFASATKTLTPYTNPLPPTIDSISVGNGTATVYYTAGYNNSSAITAHKYSLNNGSYVTLPDLTGSFTLSDLSNGYLHSIKMRSTNAAGDSVDSSANTFMPYTNPLPPTITSVTIGNETADVFFKAGFFNGSAITGYKYCITGGAFDGQTYTFTSRVDTPINISGLSNGVAYTVKLKAVNAAGESAESNSSIEFMSYVTQSSPNPPILISATTGNQCATINFVDDVNPGSEIVGYKYSLNGGAYAWANQTEPPIVVDNLVNGTQYTLRLKAVNGSGPSEQSATALTFTPSDVPSTPVILQAIPGDQSVTLQIIESELYGSALVNYHYQLNGAGDYYSTDISNGTLIIGGLTNGTSYTAKIKAENERGMSPESLSSAAFIPYGLPTPPTITNVVAGDKQLSVAFTDGDGNGAVITQYSFATVVNGVTSSYLLTEDTVSPIIINGLENGTAYAVRLKSVTVHGSSDPTDESETLTPFGAPEPPVITYVDIVDGSANIHFEEGNTNGSAITDYMYSVNDGDYEYSAQTVTPIVLPNLDLGETFTISLKAVTAGGVSSVSNVSLPFTVYSSPLPPTITSVVPDDQKLLVYFDDAILNGCTLLGYKYDLDNSGDLKWGKITTSPLEISGLENGTPYLVGLKTVCQEGESSLVNHTQTVTPSNIQLPPKIIGTLAGDQSIVVSYANPNLNGAVISGYSYSLNSESEYVSVPADAVDASASTITISGLTNGENYVVRIKSVSNVGTSGVSNATDDIKPYTNPSPPTITRVITGSQVAYVYFTDGSLNGSSDILGYQFSLDGTNYIWSKETASPLTLNGLTNNIAYNVRVIAVSATGSSAPSAPSSSFVPYAAPEPPTVTNIKTGNETALITVEDGLTNGRPIIGYQYSLNGGEYVSVDTTNPITISGLTNGTTYVASIKSVSIAGSSLTAGLSSAFVPYTTPSAPIITSITPSNNSLIISVSNLTLNGILENGIEILGYSYSLNGGAYTFLSNNSTTFTISGLTNGVSYTVSIKIVCPIGISDASTVSAAYTPRDAPSAPLITSVEAGTERASLYFIDGSNNGGSAITGYKYSYDGVTYYTALQTTSPIILYSLSNAVLYNVRLKATNIVGDSAISNISEDFMPFGVPFAPVITSIVPGNASAIVYIDPVNDNGSPIIKYRYTIGSAPIDISGTELPIIITELKNKTVYNIKIIATNIAGDSYASNAMSVLVGTPTVPVITEVVAIPRGLRVFFEPANDNGNPLTQYSFLFEGKGPKTTRAAGMTSPITITSLTNGLPYNVMLQAVNKNGASLSSNALGDVVPFDIPSKITITNVIPQYSAALVNFKEPPNNGSPIIKYAYALNAETTFTDLSGLTPPIRIPDLPNNEKYTIKMVAYNEAGMSPVSGSSKSVIYVYTPPAQVKITSITAGYEKLTVVFKPPAPNGAPILTYKYALNGSTEFIDAETTTLPLVINGLTNNTSYNVRIIATNEAGDSVASNPAAKPVTFVYLPPNAPALVSATGGNQSVKLVFNVPAIRGAPITGYKYSFDGGETKIDISGNTSPFTITGLTNDVPYNVILYADSDAGLSLPSLVRNFTPVYKAPDRPTLGTIIALNQGASVAFTAGAENGAPITNYLYSLDGGETTTSLDSTNTPFNITGLTNDIAYSLILIAVNEVGNSVPSLPKLFTPIYKEPSPPKIGTISTTTTGAKVAFTAGAFNGSPITTYLYSINGGSFEDANVSTGPIMITGLTTKTTYSVVLKAVNQVGESLPSASKSFTTK